MKQKLINYKIILSDKINNWYQDFDQKTGFNIWKSMRIINWIILLIIIPFLPLVVFSLGFEGVNAFDSLVVSWGLYAMITVFIILAITLTLQWWFSKFSDYKKDEK